ncbi:TPA: amino acid ABC transporter ATP-binding protein [Streptococcus suis]
MFEVKNLTKRFGQQTICKDFDMTMEPGQISLLVGPSGSGKTTILRMINGLESADQGDIGLGIYHLRYQNAETPPKDQAAYQREVGLVFQDYQLFPHLTVMDNLTLAPHMNRLADKPDLEAQAMSWLEKFALSDKAQVLPEKLSGGQKQRVAIIRAMMLKPKLLCFDEPTAALDAENSMAFADIIKELANSGTMVLIVTHDGVLVQALEGEAQIIDASQFVGA